MDRQMDTHLKDYYNDYGFRRFTCMCVHTLSLSPRFWGMLDLAPQTVFHLFSIALCKLVRSLYQAHFLILGGSCIHACTCKDPQPLYDSDHVHVRILWRNECEDWILLWVFILILQEKLNISCVHSSAIGELFRGIRAQMCNLITGMKISLYGRRMVIRIWLLKYKRSPSVWSERHGPRSVPQSLSLQVEVQPWQSGHHDSSSRW